MIFFWIKALCGRLLEADVSEKGAVFIFRTEVMTIYIYRGWKEGKSLEKGQPGQIKQSMNRTKQASEEEGGRTDEVSPFQGPFNAVVSFV
jgi:hypothetical protein